MFNGQIIRNLMEERGWTRTDVCNKMGWSGGNSFESFMGGNPTAANLEKMADIFEVSIDSFFKRGNSLINNHVVGDNNNVQNNVNSENYELVRLKQEIQFLHKIIDEKNEQLAILKEVMNLGNKKP